MDTLAPAFSKAFNNLLKINQAGTLTMRACFGVLTWARLILHAVCTHVLQFSGPWMSMCFQGLRVDLATHYHLKGFDGQTAISFQDVLP